MVAVVTLWVLRGDRIGQEVFTFADSKSQEHGMSLWAVAGDMLFWQQTFKQFNSSQ